MFLRSCDPSFFYFFALPVILSLKIFCVAPTFFVELEVLLVHGGWIWIFWPKDNIVGRSTGHVMQRSKDTVHLHVDQALDNTKIFSNFLRLFDNCVFELIVFFCKHRFMQFKFGMHCILHDFFIMDTPPCALQYWPKPLLYYLHNQ